jgi:UDP-glucose 4-epimerase
MESVSLRYFNVFGPRQDPNSQYAAVVPRFVQAIADGRPVVVHGDGEQSRDFTYVANVVEANLLAAEAPGAKGAILNVATGTSETVNSLAETIGRLLDRPVEKTFEPTRAADVRASWADLSRTEATIGYVPSISFEEGLRRTIDSLLGSEA